MSFLAGRLAGKEGSYFLQESKHAVNRLAEKINAKPTNPSKLPSPAPPSPEIDSQADVLPEVLRHALPSKIFSQPSDPSSFSRTSKWALHSDPKAIRTVSLDKLNPLRAFLSFPQVTFGPKRWELPKEERSMLASTANELRKDKYEAPINPEKLKAAAEGLANVAKAFAFATVVVFGGASLLFGLAVSKLEMHNSDDIRTKGRDLVQPKLEIIKEQVFPLKIWAEEMSKKWHLEREGDIKERPMIKGLSKILGPRTSS
ncbi:Coiled-coil domain-containing protein 21 putative isoform 2 [Tripterygium wilfordii]|uniref:Coiled-coil domain-containing protein 21 putative isoform 2 n=1 Tax=Tripterygium wilfordii TaxID=458696 RepID=A0A7J7D503_TRIWF|nr:uncharacterized protein LOC120007980 [Tripterygium wilfordii]KAF5741420.1 Coiled-coil domain-containing protein 21 putative isoform 2 [Tripterygium wilfordii]